MNQFKDRIVGLERLPAKKLQAHPQNWRKHPDSQKEAMRGILGEIGFADAVVVRKLRGGKYQILDGHLRSELDPEGEVPCLVVDLSEQEALKFLATFDRASTMATMNSEVLSGLLAQLKAEGDQLVGMVWPDYIIEPLLAADWSPAPEEEMPERPASPGGPVKPLSFSPEQWLMVEAAIKKCQGRAEQELDNGAALMVICQQFLVDGNG